MSWTTICISRLGVLGMECAHADSTATGRHSWLKKWAGLAVLLVGLTAAFGLRCVDERAYCRVCGEAELRKLVSFSIPFTRLNLVSIRLSSHRLDDGYLSSLLEPNATCGHDWRVYHRNRRCLCFGDLPHPMPYPCAGEVSDVSVFHDYLITERPEALTRIRKALQDGYLLVVSSILAKEEFEFNLMREARRDLSDSESSSDQ